MSTLSTSLLPDPAAPARGKALPVEHPLDSWSGAQGQVSLTRVVHYDYDPTDPGAFLSALPAAGAPLAGATWMQFVDFTSRQLGALKMEATLKYEQAEQDPGEALPDLPPSTCEFDESAVEIDVRRHPEFATSVALYGDRAPAEFWDDEAAAFIFREIDDADAGYLAARDDLWGLFRYISGSVVVRCREYFYNLGAVPSADVGKRETPAGVTLPADWDSILTSHRWAQQGSFWVEEKIYQLSSKKAPAWLYEDA